MVSYFLLQAMPVPGSGGMVECFLQRVFFKWVPSKHNDNSNPNKYIYIHRVY